MKQQQASFFKALALFVNSKKVTNQGLTDVQEPIKIAELPPHLSLIVNYLINCPNLLPEKVNNKSVAQANKNTNTACWAHFSSALGIHNS
jgi:hypothetical protein